MLRRVLAVVLLAIVLSGCTSPASDVGDESSLDAAQPALTGPVTLAEGSMPWYEDGATLPPNLVFTITGFCTNADGGFFPYEFHLTDRMDAAGVPHGASVELTASWGPEDWAGLEVRPVVDAGNGTFVGAPPIASGQTAVLEPSPDADGRAWDIWLCMVPLARSPDGRARPTPPFVGDIDIRLVATP